MNQAEVLAWLDIIPYTEKIGHRPNNGCATVMIRKCSDDLERIEVLHDLLIHGGTDGMSDEDVIICLEALEYLCLRRGVDTTAAGWRHCQSCHRSILLTVEGHRAHLGKCCKHGRGRPQSREVDGGEAIKRREAKNVPQLSEDNRDGLEGIAEALPCMLPGVSGSACESC